MANEGARRQLPGQSWLELIATDSGQVPQFMAEDGYRYLGSEPIDASRYTSDAIFRLEVERMWPNVWQFAAREEDMPDPGDVVVYENAGRSYLLARQQDGSVRAVHNVCLHRGRKLRTESGRAREFLCPYHGFSWNLDGSLKEIPCRWDFPHLDDASMHLPEAQVGRWGGYIFIRENPEGPTLEEYLAPLPEHFARWPHDRRTTSAWVAKVIPANWKAVMEAFMEAWHNYRTHPQITPFVGDANSQYNVLGRHVNCAYTPQAVMSPQMDQSGKTEQWIVDEMMRYRTRAAGGDSSDVTLPDGGTARRAMGAKARRELAALHGGDLAHASDAEVLDAIYYAVFPNFHPWGGFMPSICYRFRPWPDQRRTLMEVRMLTPVPPGQPVPRSVPMELLGEEQSWTECRGLSESLAKVLDQDVTNVVQVQAGLEVSKTGTLEIGDFQEVRMRHFHQVLTEYVGT